MKKEPDPDLQFPDEAAIEEHVRQMMDISVPDDNKPGRAVSPPPKPVPISDTPPSKTTPQPIAVTNESEETPVDTAPPLAGSPEKHGAKKSIVIRHFTDEPLDVSAKQPTPSDEVKPPSKRITIRPLSEEDLPEPIDNPLIPTDKLVSTIEPTAPEPSGVPSQGKSSPKKAAKSTGKSKTAAKAKTKKKEAPGAPAGKVTTVGKTASPADLDAEIANAFEISKEEAEPAEQGEPEKVSEPSTAPELPTEGSEEHETAEEAIIQEPASEPKLPEKPKFNKFTPLTDIRPRMPASETPQGPLHLDDTNTNQAVDDIMITEADHLLDTPISLETPRTSQAVTTTKRATTHRSKTHPKRRPGKVLLILSVLLLIAAIILLAVPAVRVAALNRTGLRTGVIITALDQSTGQPLSGATVTISGKSTQTDIAGRASLSGLKFGMTHITIIQRAYATATLELKLDLGRHQPPAVSLQPTGTQYTVLVTDYLSGKPVKVTVKSNEATAVADQNGVAKLTVDKSVAKPFQAVVTANGYRAETLTLDPAKATQKQELKLVLARKYTFVSKQSGTYDVYATDLDDQNQRLVLKGTGREQIKSTTLVHDSQSDLAALTSVRGTAKAADGTPVSTLTLINAADTTVSTISQAAQIQIIGWEGDYLVYTQVASDSKTADPARQQLVGYNVRTKKSQILAKANYFNHVLAAAGKLYYAPSSAYQPVNSVGFFQINADGSGKVTLLLLETWNIYRPAYDHLSLSVQQDWYDFKLGDKAAIKQATAPPVLESRQYRDSPDGKAAAWISNTANQPKLMLYNKKSGKDKELVTTGSLTYPVHWLTNNVLIYRNTGVDYTYSLDSGVSKKLHDQISDIPAIIPWQVQ